MNTAKSRKAFTLIEITLVLGLTLGLAAALIFGLAAFQQGSDKAKCLLNISNVQKAVRAWASMNEIPPGTPLTAMTFPGTTPSHSILWGTDQSFLSAVPFCPRDATAIANNAAGKAGTLTGAPVATSYIAGAGAWTTIPAIGTAYLRCNSTASATTVPADRRHRPKEVDGVRIALGK